MPKTPHIHPTNYCPSTACHNVYGDLIQGKTHIDYPGGPCDWETGRPLNQDKD